MAEAATPADLKSLHSFAEFYPVYLGEHRDRTCRRLHFVGSSLALVCLWALAWTRVPGFALAAVVCAYGCAWLGHFRYERNRPASFQRPLWSFMGDWRMYFEMWTGRVPF